jgi:hypothetical protein
MIFNRPKKSIFTQATPIDFLFCLNSYKRDKMTNNDLQNITHKTNIILL